MLLRGGIGTIHAIIQNTYSWIGLAQWQLLFSILTGIFWSAPLFADANNLSSSLKPERIVELKSILPEKFNAISSLKLDIKTLMSFYSPHAKWWQDKNCIHPGGCIGTEQSIWVWANATYVMANYQALTGDAGYQKIIKMVYTNNWQHIYPKKYFDDDLWWALALIRVYEVTKDKDALNKAQKLVAYVNNKGLQNVCRGSGGVYWNLARTEVGTIANMLYVIDNAGLYQITHKESYRQEANQTWNWYRQSGLLGMNYAVFDHYQVVKGQCDKRSDWPFTYNVGVLLSALGALAAINHDPRFIEYGRHIALASLRDFTKTAKTEVISEYCNDVFECAQNAYLFKGIYVYELARFALLTNDRVFIKLVQITLDNNFQKIKQIQGATPIYAFDWSLPVNYKQTDKQYNPADILSHLSVVYLELGEVLITQFDIKSLLK